MKTLRSLLFACLAVGLTLPASAHDIVRRSGSDLPIATSVGVPDGAEWVLVGMTLPGITDADAPAGSAERLGDTAAQTRSVLDQIAAELEAQGFAMSDVVKLNVYLVGDPARDGMPDYAGLMSAYLQHFRQESGGLPVRSTVQVAGLPVPGARVAIDAIAARSGDHSHD
jgi:enamine deaminase RidA (YjgF/YER057c/UK114 family)